MHPTRDICPDCYDREEQDFAKVKEFLWDKKHASVDEVSEKTGVKKKKVVKFIRNGRLNASGLAIELYLTCEGCGEPITEGRFCPTCREKLIQGFATGPDKQRDDNLREHEIINKGKMYTADRRKRDKLK